MQPIPESFRKTFRLVAILAMLAWATRAAFGAEPATSQERFVTGGGSSSSGLVNATLELRGEATIVGGDVKLKQICRWSDADATAFEPVADLIVTRMAGNTPFRAISLSELKQTMQDAGVNLGLIRFAGTTHCTITRSDVTSDERSGLQDWINARTAPATTQPATGTHVLVRPSAAAINEARTAAALQPAKIDGLEKSAPQQPEAKQYHSLRELLTSELAERLALDPAAMQIRFNPVDDKVLNLSEPHFRFHVDGQRTRNLGNVSWDVTIVADGGASQKTPINAIARAWQDQLIVRRPMAGRQTIREEDLVDRRVLVDTLADESAGGVKRDQVVGQLASRELRAGTVLTTRLVEAAPLAQSGDLISVSVEQGNVQISTAARAMEGGSYGQTIKVKNEATNSVYDVTLVGPKRGRMATAPSKADAATANLVN